MGCGKKLREGLELARGLKESIMNSAVGLQYADLQV